jgi:hypothetical protein
MRRRRPGIFFDVRHEVFTPGADFGCGNGGCRPFSPAAISGFAHDLLRNPLSDYPLCKRNERLAIPTRSR